METFHGAVKDMAPESDSTASAAHTADGFALYRRELSNVDGVPICLSENYRLIMHTCLPTSCVRAEPADS